MYMYTDKSIVDWIGGILSNLYNCWSSMYMKRYIRGILYPWNCLNTCKVVSTFCA